MITIAGRRRMLSQRISQCAFAIRAGIDLRSELALLLEEWLSAHQALRFGDGSRRLPSQLASSLRDMYIERGIPLTKILTAAESMLKDTASDRDVDAATDMILANER